MQKKCYIRETKTGKVHAAASLAEILAKYADIPYEEITEDAYRVALEQSEQNFSLGSSMSKVYATVPKRVFENFAARCKHEGVEIGDAFAELVTQYSAGAVLTHVKKHAKGTGADYLAGK